jgi:hypothetical protein
MTRRIIEQFAPRPASHELDERLRTLTQREREC